MAARNSTTGMYDDDFEILFEASEPQRCMFDLDGRCDNDPVEGHFIQEGLLKLIQDSQKQVLSFYNYRAKNWRELDFRFALNHPISPSEAAKCRFLCSGHEEFFWPVENPRPDWDDAEHRARLAYRSCLINRYIKEWFITFTSRIQLQEVVTSQQQQLLGALPLETAIRNYLTGADTGQLCHNIAYIQCKPTIAASGVILHPPLGSHIYDTRSDRVIPMGASPIAIALLPSIGIQVAMFSYAVDGTMDAIHLLDKLEYHNESIGTARLSKKLIEEVEAIHISPRAWASLGKFRQETITKYWIASLNTSESELDIPPSRLDLFAAQA